MGVAGGNIIPVDNRPDGLQVIRADILVLQVIGMLPDINSEQRNQSYENDQNKTGYEVLASGGQKGILVLGGCKLDTFGDWIISLQANDNASINNAALPASPNRILAQPQYLY